MEQNYKVFPYRWVILVATMLVNMTIQVLWIAYSPITSSAALYYGVSEMAVGFFAMSFMIAFIPLSIPVSWLIDRYGYVLTVGTASVAVGVLGIVRGIAGQRFALAMVATCGIAAAQPFLLNSWTKIPAAWFPARERATAVGLITIASILGTAVGLVLTPILAGSMDIAQVQMVYGAAASVAALVFVLVAKEKPRLPPDESASRERAFMVEGLKHALKTPSFVQFLVIVFVGMGIFNGVTTWVEGIVRPRGIGSDQAGILGAIMLVGGIIGAMVIPHFSDKAGKRKPYIVIGLMGAIPGLVGLALAQGFVLIAASAFVLGFFLIAVNPVGMQYAAEVAHPTPEGTSNGLVTLAGQVSVLLVYAMEAINNVTGTFTASLIIVAVLLGASAILATRLKENDQR
ncbi:MAG: putative glucarate transporter [Spirochaetes bacterium ADurb.Bin110]|nr:MAG: putative glucarate transporter [Spirochaetes bacterium ADurb.Bin110]